MVYSVFNWRTGRYRYYEGDGEGLGVRPQPRVTPNDPGGKGHRLEDLMPVLPAAARPIGDGAEPRGRLATTGDGNVELSSGPVYGASVADGFGDTASNPLLTSPWLTLGVWAGVMWAGFKFATWAGQQIAGVKAR